MLGMRRGLAVVLDGLGRPVETVVIVLRVELGLAVHVWGLLRRELRLKIVLLLGVMVMAVQVFAVAVISGCRRSHFRRYTRSVGVEGFDGRTAMLLLLQLLLLLLLETYLRISVGRVHFNENRLRLYVILDIFLYFLGQTAI
jgi:hypothetical protein